MLTSYLQMLLIEAIDNTITVSFQKGGNIWEMSNIFDCKLSELERGVTEIQLQVGTLSKSGLVVIAPSRILEVTHDGWRNRPCHALLSSFFKRSSQNRRPTWGKSCIDHWLRASFFSPPLHLLFHFSLARSHSSSIDEAASMTKIRLVQIDRKNLVSCLNGWPPSDGVSQTKYD